MCQSSHLNTSIQCELIYWLLNLDFLVQHSIAVFALAVNLDFPSAISNSYTRAQCGISFIHVYLDVCDSEWLTHWQDWFSRHLQPATGRKLKISYSNWHRQQHVGNLRYFDLLEMIACRWRTVCIWKLKKVPLEVTNNSVASLRTNMKNEKKSINFKWANNVERKNNQNLIMRQLIQEIFSLFYIFLLYTNVKWRKWMVEEDKDL